MSKKNKIRTYRWWSENDKIRVIKFHHENLNNGLTIANSHRLIAETFDVSTTAVASLFVRFRNGRTPLPKGYRVTDGKIHRVSDLNKTAMSDLIFPKYVKVLISSDVGLDDLGDFVSRIFDNEEVDSIEIRR